MTDYISRAAIRVEINRLPASYSDEYDTHGKLDMLSVLAAIERAPAADVRPVVLCRDCMYARPDMYGGTIWCNCPKLNPDMVYENFFCAYGKKKEAETDV